MTEIRKDDQGRRLCTAHTTAGNQCRGAAMKGATVCNKHGGSAPQVRNAAARRMLEAMDPATAEHVRLVTEAKSERDRLTAIKMLYDHVDMARLIATVAVSEGIDVDDAEKVVELMVAWPERRW